MPRLRLLDFRLSDGPPLVGICKEDIARCASLGNRVQRRLIYAKEAGNEGFWGSFAEVAFNNVSRLNPYITTSREIARIEAFNICDRAIPNNNQYQEYLQFGNGRMPQRCRGNGTWQCLTEAYARNNAVTFVNQSVFPCILRVYSTSPDDVSGDKRILIQGLDPVGNVIYSNDNGKQVNGLFMDFDAPFADASIQLNQINGFQKDVTEGQIQIFQVDPVTGAQTLLLTMEPGETVAGYRRYYLNNLPNNCCHLPPGTVPPQPVRVTAIAKLEILPVVVDTDYFILQNLEAFIEECQSIRMSGMDNSAAQQLAMVHHVNAIRLLNAELVHYLGKQSPAVSFKPFGSARLEKINIGMI